MTILRYFGDMAFTMLCALPAWALIRWLWLKRGKKPLRWGREVLLALLVLYMVALAGQTILPQIRWTGQRLMIEPWDSNGCNYIPLYTIRQMFLAQKDAPVYVAVNLLGNILVFSPLGFLPPLVWRRFERFVPTILFGGVCSACIELVQPLVGRNRDIDDLILNTLGCALGYLLCIIFRRMRNTYDRTI